MPYPSHRVQQYCEVQGFSPRVCESGLEHLLKGWEINVSEIESGYKALWDEYLNDIDGRQIISELIPLADEAEQAMVELKLPSADRRFLDATVPVETCIWGNRVALRRQFDSDAHWWYFRIPRDLSAVEDRENWP